MYNLSIPLFPLILLSMTVALTMVSIQVHDTDLSVDFTLKHVQEHGLASPLVFKDSTRLGMK